MEQKYNIAVIGGGPAGYVAAIRGSQLGAKVVLFEQDSVGGTCLNRGCIPTKTYLKTAEYIKHIRAAAERGILLDSRLRVDMPKAVQYKDKVVKTLTGGVSSLLKANHVDVVCGTAVLASENAVQCGDTLYLADRILLCGGSAPSLPPLPGMDGRDVVTSTELLNGETCPERLCILGGGVIGCELATVFRAFGSEVTIIETAERIAPMFEKDISEEVAGCLRKDGIQLMLHTRVEKIETLENGSSVVTDKGAVFCDTILVATGRRPELSCLGSLTDKIRLDNGRIAVNEYLETNIPGIYACGDINGKLMLTHAAYYMGRIAAENCLGARNKCRLDTVPNCMYAEPEVASVGLTEEEAAGKYGDRICVGKFKLGANGRAIAYGERAGFVKVVADKITGELLGAHIVGPMANELINEAVAVMESEMTIRELTSRVVHPHPSFSEAFYEACLDAQSIGLHLPPKKK